MSTKNNHTWSMRWRWKDGDIRKVLATIAGTAKPVIHVCSGSSAIGDVRIDLKKIVIIDSLKGRFRTPYTGPLNVIGDMYNLPVQTGSAGTVICDPPYVDDAQDTKLISELVRILKPGGTLLFYAPWVPCHTLLNVVSIDPMLISRSSGIYKLFAIYRKTQASLFDYQP